MPIFSFLQVRNPKDDETPIEASTQIFGSLLPSHYPLWKRLFNPPRIVSFEIYYLNQTIYYYIAVPQPHETFMTSLLASSYQKSRVLKTPDPLETIFKSRFVEAGEMVLTNSYYLPLKTHLDFSKVDPLASLVGFLAKQEQPINFGVQLLVSPSSFHWQNHTLYTADHYKYNKETTSYTPHPQKQMMAIKASHQGGRVAIRLIASSDSVAPLSYLHNLAGTFGGFSMGEGNQLRFAYPRFTKDRLLSRIRHRKFGFRERYSQILNAQELATLWHPSGKLLAGIKNIAWGKTLGGEPPENLPTALNVSEEEKKDINYFATTEFKNKDTIFGVKTADRRKHIYIIGKTGAGKSTMISNMAIDDIRKGRGVGIIDPHGDLTESILDYIPNRRVNDVVYLEPFDTQRPFSLNVLEIKNKQQKELIASGIVSIFFKIYGDSWGPRLEYILRILIFTLLEIPNATLFEGLRLLSDERYRARVIPQITDPVIRNFWDKEFAGMTDKLRTEAIAPIQNKMGQFVSSKMVRNIVGVPRSTINLEEIMNSGKILLLNLSQGKFGEDNAALLGAMMITQIQLAAMNRAFVKEEERRDFFLYVDEFQNFATTSFIKILSEARKYRLALTLANQYSDQLDEHVQKAIFGNAGTIVTFVVGAGDALNLQSEFAQIYTQNDLVSLGKHEIITKLSIDNMTSFPFPAKTLPPPSLRNDNREKIIRLSKEKYGRKVEENDENQPSIGAEEPFKYKEQHREEDENKNSLKKPEVKTEKPKQESKEQSQPTAASIYHNNEQQNSSQMQQPETKQQPQTEVDPYAHLPPSLRPRVKPQAVVAAHPSVSETTQAAPSGQPQPKQSSNQQKQNSIPQRQNKGSGGQRQNHNQKKRTRPHNQSPQQNIKAPHS